MQSARALREWQRSTLSRRSSLRDRDDCFRRYNRHSPVELAYESSAIADTRKPALVRRLQDAFPTFTPQSISVNAPCDTPETVHNSTQSLPMCQRALPNSRLRWCSRGPPSGLCADDAMIAAPPIFGHLRNLQTGRHCRKVYDPATVRFATASSHRDDLHPERSCPD